MAPYSDPLKSSESPAPAYGEDLYDASPAPPSARRNQHQMSPSPVTSNSSDKENPRSRDKGKERAAMPPPERPTPAMGERGKRRRSGESLGPNRRQRTEQTPVEVDALFYDPDQSVEERRALRKGMRSVHKTVNENRTEYLQPESTGLYDAIVKQNEYSKKVKQTSDATIDSRFLVDAADLAYKKSLRTTLGDTAQGVDIEEFLGKCVIFMRQGNQEAEHDRQGLSGTQRRRRREQFGDDDGVGDEGDTLNWEHLGRTCLQYNTRPAVPGFLLGPLSIERKARKVPQRRAAGLKLNNVAQTQPQVLKADQIEKSESANSTEMCKKIMQNLTEVTEQNQMAAEAEAEALGDDLTDAETKAILDKHGVRDSGALDFFKFVINPHSFGQTVENMFYVSFLIRDGKVALVIDDDGLPTIEVQENTRTREEAAAHDISKAQAVLSIDMALWEDLIDAFDIKEPMIPHRQEEVGARGRGWY